jgi:PmbA protein
MQLMLDESLPGFVNLPRIITPDRNSRMSIPLDQSLLDQSALIERAGRLVVAARRAGADAADAVAVRSVSISVDVRNAVVEESQHSESDDIGLRVLVGQRQAVVSTNDLSADVAQLAERAVAMAKVAPEDPFAGLADSALLASEFPELDLIDRDLPSINLLEERAKTAEAAGLAVKGVSQSDGASASAGIGGMVLVTSHGFEGAYLRSRHALSVSAIAGKGTAMERDYESTSALHLVDLDPIAKVGRTAGERAVERLDPRKAQTMRAPVVFDRRISGSLVTHLAGAINGSAVARKTSFLKDKLGERLFAPRISILDDPSRRRGLRSHPFDGEGVAARKLTIVEDGVLKSWLLDCATARELNAITTGHAQRSVSSTPLPGWTNLHLEAGLQNPEDLLDDISEGFYVTELIGMGVNQVTGDYSRGASGFWIKSGQKAYPVSEVTIAGNLIEMFRNLTPANDLEFRSGSNAPTVRVEGLTIGGR